MKITDTIEDQHANGVHVHCHPARKVNRTVGGTGTAQACMPAARGVTVERFHGHDFDGPLPCDCDDA